MTLDKMAAQLGWRPLTEYRGADREVCGCYCGDLLSWVMGRAKEDDVWLTVMGNVNAIAVATLAGAAGIVLTENATLDEDAKKRAEEREVAIYAVDAPTYETAVGVHGALGV